MLLAHAASAIRRKSSARNFETRLSVAANCCRRLLAKKGAIRYSLRRNRTSMARILIGISSLLVALSLILGFLNGGKVKALRDDLASADTARDSAVRLRLASEKKLKASDKVLSAANEKAAAAEEKAKSNEADLSKAQNDKAELEAKLQTSENEISDLQKRVADATAGAGAAGASAGLPNDLKAQLDDMKKQLDAAEQEKSILGDKVRAAQDRVAGLEEEKKRRVSGTSATGVHGKVLAVNQAYNFVVLSIGEHQGVEPNSELLVMRQGALIGKIRISSVEPTTSIGDIMTNSLPRGVEVLPGDVVVYAGSTNS
jgi:hypothetical protein